MSMIKTLAAEQGSDTKWWEHKAAENGEPTGTHKKSIQTITFNTSSFNDDDRTFVAIASTPVVDRYGDTVNQEGWVLDNFLKNPVIPWAHDYWQPPVGRVVEIGINEQGNLQFKYQAPPKGIYPFADTIWELYRNQFMFAFSVGFSAIEAEGDWQNGYEFTKMELLEISAVVVPANPQAVALAFSKGTIDPTQLKDFKKQMLHAVESVNKVLEQQENNSTDKTEEPEKKTAKANEVEVKVNLDAEEVKELVKSINEAADRLEAAHKLASDVQEKGAISSSLPTADKDLAWDSGKAIARVKEWASNGDEINFTKYKKAFFWVDPSSADKQGGYKLPFADVVDGELKAVWRGVAAAMAALNGSRGGVDIPDSDRQAVYAQIKKYYAKFDEEAPELKSLTTSATVDDTRGMETKAGASLSKANKDKLKACHKAMSDIKSMCDEHMGKIAEMLGEEMDTEAEKAAEVTETKAVEQKDATGAETEEVEVKSEGEAAESTEETKEDVQHEGDDDAAKGEGEVNSEESAGADDDEGADHKESEEAAESEEADKADNDEELVDPDNLTPEQAEKVAEAVNQTLSELKNNS